MFEDSFSDFLKKIASYLTEKRQEKYTKLSCKRIFENFLNSF